jgi:hypothetical protein
LIATRHGYLRIIKGFRSQSCFSIRAAGALLAALAYVTIATAASAAAADRPDSCAQPQYHSGSQAESALRPEVATSTVPAVSHPDGVAISPELAGSSVVPIGPSIASRKCRSISFQITTRNRTQSLSNRARKVGFNSDWKLEAPQYQARAVRYQPGIAAVATKSAHGDELRDRAQMIKIGAVLAVAYLVFLTVWFWATRLRQRPASARTGIDRRRRIE